ncbi:unnamed protein product [Brachionus calyciflorus]|uniref:Uncharacterized protein n=1 Tax=Brachionus calyciflorus TaxID=104777 RepID=A0A814EUA1_9BILA|nr:unnamed protein product [Brachionus calyciflorus]
MNRNRLEICEYYSKMINEIDTKTEEIIFRMKKQEIECDYEINSDRNKIIAKIREIEKIKLNNLKDSDSIFQDLFCIFIPQKVFSGNISFCETIGKLALINYPLDENTIERLKRIASHLESIEGIIFYQLINANRDELIIDLTKIENNQIKNLDIADARYQSNEQSIKFINRYLNVESVKKLKISICQIIENNIYESFKHLTSLVIDGKYVKSLNENVFNGLENIEILKFHNSNDLNFESNVINKLVNLRELFFDRFKFNKVDIFNKLEKLEKLYFNLCSASNFEMNSLNGLNSLKSLQFIGSRFSYSFINHFVSLNSVKCLEIDKRDFKCLKINPNLEILNIILHPFHSIEIEIVENNFRIPIQSGIYNIPDNIGIPDSIGNLKMLKFLKLYVVKANDIFRLNELTQLEYLDLTLWENLDEFNLEYFTKLKYLVLTCKKIPKFIGSNTLQGLELKNVEIISNDVFDNLVNLDYLALIDPQENMFDTFISTEFGSINKLKYFKSLSNSFNKENDELKKVKRALEKFFKPKKFSGFVDYYEFCKFSIEVMLILDNEEVHEIVYFEKYLQISECVREFILNIQSAYCYRNFKCKRYRPDFKFYFEKIDYNDGMTEREKERLIYEIDDDSDDDL